MPGNSPGEAVDRFLKPIKDAISVLGNAHLTKPASHPQINVPQVVTIAKGEGITVSSSLYGPLTLRATLGYVVIACEEGDPRGPYRCRTRSYIHSIYDDPGSLLLAWHWHPESKSEDRGPHCHVGPTRLAQAMELHIPTPRVSLEEVITTAIDSLGATATVEEAVWRPILSENHEVHAAWREWEHRTDAPTNFS